MPLYYLSIQPISSYPPLSVVPSHLVFPQSALPGFPHALWSPDRLGSDVPSAPQSSINTGIVPVYTLSGTVSATFRIYHMSVLPHSLPDLAGNSLHAVCNLIHCFFIILSLHSSVFCFIFLTLLILHLALSGSPGKSFVNTSCWHLLHLSLFF